MEKYIYKARLLRVVDGDTVDAMIDLGFDTWVKKRIRFYGLDTWECRTRDLEEKEKGLAAKARTKEMLTDTTKDKSFFRIRSYGTGKYGRVLAEVFIKNEQGTQIDVCKTLIEEGHAYVYDGGKKKALNSKLRTGL